MSNIILKGMNRPSQSTMKTTIVFLIFTFALLLVVSGESGEFQLLLCFTKKFINCQLPCNKKAIVYSHDVYLQIQKYDRKNPYPRGIDLKIASVDMKTRSVK
jgi:hypothetical protein